MNLGTKVGVYKIHTELLKTSLLLLHGFFNMVALFRTITWYDSLGTHISRLGFSSF
jgi:hypothetical protein